MGVESMNKPQDECCKVANKEELLEAMKKKEFYICIQDELNEEVKTLLKGNFSEEESMGAELGLHGALTK